MSISVTNKEGWLAILYGHHIRSPDDIWISFGIVGKGDYQFTKTESGWNIDESVNNSGYTCIGHTAYMDNIPPKKGWDTDLDENLITLGRCLLLLIVG